MGAEVSSAATLKPKNKKTRALQSGHQQVKQVELSSALNPSALLDLQNTLGNASLMRRLRGGDVLTQANVMRDNRNGSASGGAATAQENSGAQEQQMAQQLLQTIQQQGGLNIAVYMINLTDNPNKYENDDEFKTQAVAYASDHQTFSLRNGKLARGLPIGIDEAVTSEINHVVSAATALLQKFPDLAQQTPAVQVQTLNIFTHGSKRGLKAGATGNRWIRAKHFTQGLAQYLTASPTINLYACSTAGTVASGGGNFATAVQQILTQELQQIHGEEAQAAVWGHKSARHTTYNPDLVGVGAGGDLQGALAEQLAQMALTQRSIQQPTAAQQAQVLAAAKTAIHKVFPNGKFTGSTDPRQVYFRDIPLMGIARVWRNLTGNGTSEDFADLGMSEAATARIARGAALFQTDFQTQLAGFNDQVNRVLDGVAPLRPQAPAQSLPPNLPGTPVEANRPTSAAQVSQPANQPAASTNASIHTSGMASAVERNTVFAASLGWLSQADVIVAHFQKLGLVAAGQSPNPENFARAVQSYQNRQAGLASDGILGPATWRHLRGELGGRAESTEVAGALPAMAGSSRRNRQSVGQASQPIDTRRLRGTDRVMAQIYNDYGNYLAQKSSELGINVADAAAFLKVESAGQGFSPDTDKMKIRFENHRFYSEWGKANQVEFQRHFRFDPNKHWQKHAFSASGDGTFEQMHTSQGQEWTVLEFAMSLDEEAALRSISMGSAQILGSNFAVVGYKSAKEMFEEMSGSIEAQNDGLFEFIKNRKKGVIVKALQAKDYQTAARYYNGKGKEELYARRLQDASTAYTRVLAQSNINQ